MHGSFVNNKSKQHPLLWLWMSYFNWLQRSFDKTCQTNKKKKKKFNPLISEIWLLILLSCCYTPPCKLIMRIWCYIKIKILPDKFEYTHYLFAGQCMDIIGRSCMSITSGSERVKVADHHCYIVGYNSLLLISILSSKVCCDIHWY